MDSVLSSGQNEQVVASSGRKAPESIVEDNEDELEESHQRLLFGGNTAPTSEATAESGLISGVARVGNPGQRARDNSGDLNLVAISAITAPAPSLDARSNPATYESNPLPVIAKTGVAGTLALQPSSAENIVPSGRRSGATDKIATLLAADATPQPLIPTGLRLNEMDPATRRTVTQSGVYTLFSQLETGASSTRDANAAPLVSTAATRRRSGEPAPNQIAENATIATAAPATFKPIVEPRPIVENRPGTDTRSGADSRPFADTRGTVDTRTGDIRQDQQVLPPARALVDKGLVAGATALPEVFSTVIGGRTRTTVEPQGNSDNTTVGVRARAVVESPNTSDNGVAPRVSGKTVVDGLVVGTANAGTSISDTSTNVRPRNADVQASGDQSPLLQGTHKSPYATNQAFIPQEPLPPGTKGYPNSDGPVIKVAGSFNPYGSVVTPQVMPELIAPRSARSHNSPTEPVGATDKILPTTRPTNIHADSAVVVTPGSKDLRQTLAGLLTPSENLGTSAGRTIERTAGNTDLPLQSPASRKDGQPPAQVAVKDGQVWIAAKPANDVAVTNSPVPSIVRPDGSVVIVKPADAPKGSPQEAGTQLGAGINRVVNTSNEIVNQTARTIDTGLPRAEQPRADHTNAHSHAGVIRNGEKIVDTAAPGASTVPGNLVRNSDPAIVGDKATVKTADGRIVEPGRVGDQIARSTDVARTGENSTRSGETVARTNETIARSGESGTRTNETAARTGESVARTGETNIRGSENVRTADGATKVGGESVVAKNDVIGKSNDSTIKAGESTIKASDNIARVTEIAAKSADAQVKVQNDATIVSGKSIEVAAKGGADAVVGQKVQDVAAKLGSDPVIKAGEAVVRNNDQNAVARAQDVIANAQIVSADKNIRLSDAIVKSADQVVKVDVNQPVKLDGIARGTELAVHNNQNNQNANQMIVQKFDSIRGEQNAAAKVGEQNQLVAQNNLGMQNQNIQLPGRANEQVNVPGVKAADGPLPGQKVDNVKVDQVVADILNHVRHNAKDQQAGAKILSSLDQSNNAANQQLDARVLLDAAAVRRILDGQGIVYNPATLNTIMEGIKPTGEHAVDYALPSIGSLNLSQIISLGERLQEAVAGAGSETSEPQSKPQLQQHRTKYLVKDGDTLESIAQEKLGDSRLVQLLITINRALVNYRLEGELKVAYVVPNQYLWLPTDHELEVHKKNFFGKHGKDGSISQGSSSKQNTPLIPPVSFDRTMEVSAEVSASMEDFRPASNSSSSSNPLSGNRMSAGYEVKKYVPSFGPSSGARSGSINDSKESKESKESKNEPKKESVSAESKMAGNLDKLRHAGNRKSVDLDQIEYVSTQVTHRQCYQVRQGETLMSIAASLESMGHISMWKLLAKINGFQIEVGGLGKSIENLFAGQFIVLPTTEELNEFKLMEKLGSCTNSSSTGEKPAKNAFSCVIEQTHVETPPPPALVALAQGVGGLTTVHKLSSFTRLVLNDLPHLENCFSITVEARWNGQWKPMASYECRHGQTSRHLYNKYGEIKSMELDLPPYVVKEMAREDFIRNWNGYVNSFMGEEAGHFVQS